MNSHIKIPFVLPGTLQVFSISDSFPTVQIECMITFSNESEQKSKDTFDTKPGAEISEL